MITKDEQKTYLMLLEMDETISNEITKKLTKKAKLQLAVMKFYSDGFTDYEAKNDGWFYRSFELLKDVTGIGSNHTISANLKLFEKLGLLEIKQGYITRNGKGAKVNYYRFADKKNCTNINETALTKNALTNKENCTDISSLKINELHKNCTDIKNTNCTVDIDIEKEIEKVSVISNSSNIREGETELLNFILSFLKSETREEGVELYNTYTTNNTLQTTEKDFISTFTKEVALLKGWEKVTPKTTENTSNEEGIETTDNEETLSNNETTNENAKNNTTSKSTYVDWSLNLKTAKSYFYQTAQTYAKQWAPLTENERREMFMVCVSSGFPEQTFSPFEKYIDGITIEKVEEFAKMVHEEADKYEEANKLNYTSSNTTQFNGVSEGFYPSMEETTIEYWNAPETTPELTIEAQLEQTKKLLGWSDENVVLNEYSHPSIEKALAM